MNRSERETEKNRKKKKSIQTCAHLPASKEWAGYLADSGRSKLTLIMTAS